MGYQGSRAEEQEPGLFDYLPKHKSTPQRSASGAGRSRHPASARRHANSTLNAPHALADPAVLRLSLAASQTSKDGAASGVRGHSSAGRPTVSPTTGVQRKLTVGTPGDAYEREADRAAEQMLRMPEAGAARASASKSGPNVESSSVRGGGNPDSANGQPQLDHARVQLRAMGSAGTLGREAPPHVDEVLRSPGQQLTAAMRAFMQLRFGRDFSSVRIHSDPRAARSAKQLGASAYTVGDHIVFAEGRLAPSTPAGSRLLAHELAHVVQNNGNAAIVRREPDPKGPHTAPDDARLTVKIVDTLEATKTSAIDAMVSALGRADRPYLERLGLSSKEIDILLTQAGQFEMTFGRAAELAVESAVRADSFLSVYVKRGPGRVPRGVGKPDWTIETRFRSIPVDLMTPEQVAAKLAMWRRQSFAGKPKWYIEKGLNITYDPPAARIPQTPPVSTEAVGTATTDAAGAGARDIAQVAKPSALRTAGRFLAEEAPGLVLQLVFMALFPPSVVVNNDAYGELSRKKLNPAVEQALTRQAPFYDKLLNDEPDQEIYANVTVRLDYQATGTSGGDLDLRLADVTFLDMQLANESVTVAEPKFTPTGPRATARHVTYALLLYEPESVASAKAWAKAQQEYEECVRRYGTGHIPPAAGVQEQVNPDESPCIPPRMKPMEGP